MRKYDVPKFGCMASKDSYFRIYTIPKNGGISISSTPNTVIPSNDLLSCASFIAFLSIPFTVSLWRNKNLDVA